MWFRNVSNNNNNEDDDEMESLYREMISNYLFVYTLQIRVFEYNCHPIGEGKGVTITTTTTKKKKWNHFKEK